MEKTSEGPGARACWFVGATYGEAGDQMQRFLNEGIWENGYNDKYLELVRSIQPGDRIAIKSSYTRKLNLPFDNRGQTVSVMAIKATGTVVENLGDGKKVKVDWKSLPNPREWYFFTNRSTIWRVLPGDWMTDALIGFTFSEKPQDVDRFRNAPYWRSRFGDLDEKNRQFAWTRFYEEFANKLLPFSKDRSPLVAAMNDMASRLEGLSIFHDQYEDGQWGPMKDICPFTVMGTFNRGVTDANRKIIAGELASFLGVKEPVPVTFEGIPILNNQRSWFYGYAKDRQEDDIDVLWNVFAQAIRLADSEDGENQVAFAQAYDNAAKRKGVGWNLTMGLYWVRPWAFPTLDSRSRLYLEKKLNTKVGLSGSKGRCSANDYLSLTDMLETRFQEENYSVHSFPELSFAAWIFNSHLGPLPASEDEANLKWKTVVIKCIIDLCSATGTTEFGRQQFLQRFEDRLKKAFPNNTTIHESVSKQFQVLRDEGMLKFLESGRYEWLGDNAPDLFDDEDADLENVEDLSFSVPIEAYSLDDIVSDGCFIDRGQLEKFLERLRTKKNLILQGPPGTGKTWLAKRLAYALIGQKNEAKIRVVQFHPNLSYEDFVRGWRPSGKDGKLSLVDGPFMEIINSAKQEPAMRYVIVIEEINRGSPAQILGEMLTLLEADKRTPNEAIELCYKPEGSSERVFIPDNLYVVGTMNIADRSLALVDLALRRRFAFVDMEPRFGETWRGWVTGKCGFDSIFVAEIEKRILALNEEIASDSSLGKKFRVGHSFLTPPLGLKIENAAEWFKQVVETEIGPLLEEYWFDDLGKAQTAQQRLTDGL